MLFQDCSLRLVSLLLSTGLLPWDPTCLALVFLVHSFWLGSNDLLRTFRLSMHEYPGSLLTFVKLRKRVHQE